MRLPLLLATCVALTACGGRPPPGGFGDGGVESTDAPRHDGAGSRDTGVQQDVAPLACTGPARMVLNGETVPVAVTGRMLYLNCCEAAAMVFEPLGADAPRVVVTWRAQVGMPPEVPFTVDLAALPDGVGVQVLSGCGDPPEYCPNPTDTLGDGLAGTLTVDGTTGAGYTMTLCLHGVAPAGEVHPVLRTIELWADGVTASYP